MNTQNVQHMLVDTIRGLFRDPQSAATYAQNPNGYLADKMEGYDLTGVDVPAAVNAAVQQSNMPTEMADAVNGAVYQPAPMIRVPAPREGYNDPNYVEKKFELDKDRPNLTDVNDPGVRVEADRPVFDPSDRPPIDTEVKPPEGRPVEEDKPAENYDKPADDYDKPVEDYDRPVEDYDNPVDYDYPPVLEETPPGYEQMDGGGYRYEPPADYSPDAYHPDHYGPTTEININHIEYSVSNTVITVHYDRPEIADKLAETRPYEDPYDRVDPAHDYSDAVIVQHPDYEYPPTEHYEDKPWYEDKPVDEHDDKYEEKYDDKPVDEHDDKYEEKYEAKPVDDYRDDPDRMDRDPHDEDKPQHDNQYDNGHQQDNQYGNDNGHNQQEQYDNGHQQDEYGNDNGHNQQEQYGNGHDNGHQQDEYGNGHAEPEYQAPAEAHNDYGNGGGHANDEPDTYVEPEVHHEPAAETYVEPEPYVEPEVHHEPAAETYVEPEVHHEPEPMADEMVGE